MKTLVLIFIAGFLIACGNSEANEKIKLSDGKTGIFGFETVKESESEKVLHVTFTINEIIQKSATADSHIREIWNRAKIEAEENEIGEGVIKYIYLYDFDEEHQKPVHKIILYETTRIENGSWKIRKVSD